MVNDKKSNDSEIQFQVVDKGYVTEKEFKNYQSPITILIRMLRIMKMIFTLK